MDPKTMKRRYDEGQRDLSAERERNRYLESQCETLAREALPVRAYKSAADAAKALSGRDIADAIRTARVEVGSALEDFARVAASLDRTASSAQDRLALASGAIDDAVAKLRPEPPAHADLVEALESANAKILEQSHLCEVRADRIAFLEGEIAGLRRDAIAANTEADRALARADAAERRIRDLFYRLTRDLAPGWQGKSLRDLDGRPTHARRMHVLLQRVIDWLNEEAQRPEPKAVPPCDGDADLCGDRPDTLTVTTILDDTCDGPETVACGKCPEGDDCCLGNREPGRACPPVDVVVNVKLGECPTTEPQAMTISEGAL